MTETIFWTLVSRAIGAIVTGGVSWFTYKRSGDQLAAEASRLRKLQELTIYCLVHKPGSVKIKYGADGSVEGLVVEASANVKLPAFEGKATATGTIDAKT